LKSNSRDRVYVAKSKQPKLTPVEQSHPFLRKRTAYDHEITDFEVIDDGKIVKLDVIETVTGSGAARRERHLATVMKIGDTYKVALFVEMPAPPREPPERTDR
jgi:hypothetical protein